MSIWLAKPKCKECGHAAPDDEFNVTYNLGEMWCQAAGRDGRLIPIDGMSAKQSLDILIPALENLRSDPQRFKKFNPPNGWGDYGGLVHTLEEMIKAVKLNPKGRWETCR